MQKETLTSYCMQEIQNLILSCELLPGEQLKGEFLKSKLNVGLSPIREALARLVSTNLVECIDNVGFKVATIEPGRLADFYQSFAQLEAWLLAKAIEQGDESWEALIIAELYRLAKIEHSGNKVAYQAWSVCNERFHAALISACQLDELKQIRKNFMLRKEWYHNLAYGQFDHELVKVHHAQHRKIADLALTRQSSAACTLLYQHTMHSLGPLKLKLERLGYLTTIAAKRQG